MAPKPAMPIALPELDPDIDDIENDILDVVEPLIDHEAPAEE